MGLVTSWRYVGAAEVGTGLEGAWYSACKFGVAAGPGELAVLRKVVGGRWLIIGGVIGCGVALRDNVDSDGTERIVGEGVVFTERFSSKDFETSWLRCERGAPATAMGWE